MSKLLAVLAFAALPVSVYAGEMGPPQGPPKGPPAGHHQMRPFSASVSAADQIRNCSTAECKKRMADTIPLMEELHQQRMTALRELAKANPSEAVIEGAEAKSQNIQGKLMELHHRGGQQGGRPGGVGKPPRPGGPQQTPAEGNR